MQNFLLLSLALLISPIFADFSEVPFGNAGVAVPGLAVGDFNADGLPDVVLTHRLLGEVIVGLNRGNASPGFIETALTGLPNPLYVTTGDVDRDGDCDLVAGSATDGMIMLWRNEGGEPLAWTAEAISMLS